MILSPVALEASHSVSKTRVNALMARARPGEVNLKSE